MMGMEKEQGYSEESKCLQFKWGLRVPPFGPDGLQQNCQRGLHVHSACKKELDDLESCG